MRYVFLLLAITFSLVGMHDEAVEKRVIVDRNVAQAEYHEALDYSCLLGDVVEFIDGPGERCLKRPLAVTLTCLMMARLENDKALLFVASREGADVESQKLLEQAIVHYEIYLCTIKWAYFQDK